MAIGKYWAARKARTLGPFETRDAAIDAGKSLLPKKPGARDCYSTGYGEFGPHFSITFHEPARP